jgi:hypothetical protein
MFLKRELTKNDPNQVWLDKDIPFDVNKHLLMS